VHISFGAPFAPAAKLFLSDPGPAGLDLIMTGDTEDLEIFTSQIVLVMRAAGATVSVGNTPVVNR